MTKSKSSSALPSSRSGSGDIDVYVKLTSGRSVQYDVKPSTTIAGLVSLVAKDEGVGDRQVNLKYQGKVLVPTKTVAQYGVRAETILKTEVLVPKTLALVLNLPDSDEPVEVTVSNLDPPSTLLDIVVEKTGVSKGSLVLMCKGQKMETTCTRIMDTGIENCSEITVTKTKEKEKTTTGATPAATVETLDEDERTAVLSSFNSNGRQVEVVFSFDTTGSMYSYLTEVRSKLRECCKRLVRDIPTIRIGLVAHGDYCDQGTYVLRSVDLTNNVDTLVSFANDVPATSGGDSPECYEWVLRKAQHLDWSEDSAKALVVIGDLYPHPPSYTDQDIRWRDDLDVLKGMGIKVYAVQAGQNADAKCFYEEISEVTEGRHLRLTHFDIITDMFLAVCYREGNEQLLEDFQEELQGAGRMSEQTRAMFKELQETEEDKKEKRNAAAAATAATSSSSTPQRYVNAEWWDVTLSKENRTPKFFYNAQTDKWSPYKENTATSDVTPGEDRRGSRFSQFRRSVRNKRTGKKCNIM